MFPDLCQAQRHEWQLIKPSKARQLLRYLNGSDVVRIILIQHTIAGVGAFKYL